MDIQEQIKILEKAQMLASIPKPRKIEDFVSDMVRQDRTLSQILIVAGCTRWKGQEKIIKEIYHAKTS